MGGRSRKKVGGERSDRNFALNGRVDLEAESLAEEVDVVSEPRCEVVRLVLPVFARVKPLDSAQLHADPPRSSRGVTPTSSSHRAR